MNETPNPPPRIAIIGAGMAGLACAARLVEAGRQVTVFEKSRRPGGRIASRRAENLSFDHGAQYATARGPGFSHLLHTLQQEAAAAPWPAAGRGPDTAWVGTPSMSALPRAMTARLQAQGVIFETERQACWLHEGGIIRHLPAADTRPGHTQPTGGEATGPFDAVLLAVPAPQAALLLATRPSLLEARLHGVTIAPCWAVMLAFATPTDAPDIIRPTEGPLAWIARDSSRPGANPAPECWMLHASADWSRSHLEDAAADITATLLEAFRARTGSHAEPSYRAAHRWRYALVEHPLGEPCLWDAASRIGLCGDWCLGPRIEAAYESGVALAEAVLA